MTAIYLSWAFFLILKKEKVHQEDTSKISNICHILCEINTNVSGNKTYFSPRIYQQHISSQFATPET